MVNVPLVTPVTMPVVAPTVAIPGVVESQVPPAVASARVIVCPEQTLVGPEIALNGFTVIVAIDLQPEPMV